MVPLVSPGADLANLVNEAALFSARESRRVVSMLEFEKAKDKIMMGAERRSMVMKESEKEMTAYHEAGHAIIGRVVPDRDPVLQGLHHSARSCAGCDHVSAGAGSLEPLKQHLGP